MLIAGFALNRPIALHRGCVAPGFLSPRYLWPGVTQISVLAPFHPDWSLLKSAVAPFELKPSSGLSFPQSSGLPMTETDYFHARAVECDKLADEAKDYEAKRTLREAADNLRVMAVQAERWVMPSFRS